jgi:hypothetical protein
MFQQARGACGLVEHEIAALVWLARRHEVHPTESSVLAAWFIIVGVRNRPATRGSHHHPQIRVVTAGRLQAESVGCKFDEVTQKRLEHRLNVLGDRGERAELEAGVVVSCADSADDWRQQVSLALHDSAQVTGDLEFERTLEHHDPEALPDDAVERRIERLRLERAELSAGMRAGRNRLRSARVRSG